MQSVSITAIGLALLALGGVVWVLPAMRGDAPPLVHVPSERLTGQYGGHDVVHALQEIIETSGETGAARAVPSRDATAVLEAALTRANLSPLGELQWRRAWELATTPEAQADVLSRVRAGSVR